MTLRKHFKIAHKSFQDKFLIKFNDNFYIKKYQCGYFMEHIFFLIFKENQFVKEAMFVSK